MLGFDLLLSLPTTNNVCMFCCLQNSKVHHAGTHHKVTFQNPTKLEMLLLHCNGNDICNLPLVFLIRQMKVD